MNLLKKQGIGFLIYIIVAILAIVTLLIYVSNVNAPYYEDMNSKIVWMMLVAVLSLIATIILPLLFSGKIINVVVDVLRVAAAVIIILSGAQFIGMRLESFGYIFGSNLEMGNDAAFSAGSQAILGIILFVVTWILTVIASFLKLNSKKA